MPEYTLTVLDTPGIQPYIFGSNRLRENIGASELVRLATGQWALEELRNQGVSNVRDPVALDLAAQLDDRRIEADKLDAEVIYVGGGNTLILFSDANKARAFVTGLSRRLLEEAPGLDLAAVHLPILWETDSLKSKVDEAMASLARHKASQPPSAPLLGLGVTASCNSTGLVATSTSSSHGAPGRSYPISDAVAAKLEAVTQADRRLRRLLPPELQQAGFTFPSEFDALGRSKEEMSYIAVVHADGNGMGQFFRGVGSAAVSPRDYIDRMRAASAKVAQAATAALGQVLSALVGSIRVDEKQYYIPIGADRKLVIEGDFLPFRPLVFGGDDVTFVCDGRLGLALAVRYLKAFEAESKELKPQLHACAGIAVVKTHYPFARAYELSEKLAGSAKNYVRQNLGGQASALDWHFAASGLLGELDAIRAREYTVPRGKLTVRPVSLAGSGLRSWSWLAQVIVELQKHAETQRNKVIALREALRGGPEVTEKYLAASWEGGKLPMPGISNEGLAKTGWEDGRCGYFDAIEAMEYYVP